MLPTPVQNVAENVKYPITILTLNLLLDTI